MATAEQLEAKTVKELRELARSADVDGYSKLKKAELVDALAEPEAAPSARRTAATVTEAAREAAEETALIEGEVAPARRHRKPAVVGELTRKIADATAEQEARAEDTKLTSGNVAAQVAARERA